MAEQSSEQPTDREFAAVVVGGGGAARLGGTDKASIEIAGLTLLERSLAAVADATEVVVVADEVPTSRPVTFAREEPPGGGPAAGLLAGVARLLRPPTWVVALAVDMPLVGPGTVRRLVAAAEGDGAVLVDPSGRVQYLCAAYSVVALRRAVGELGDDTHGLPMRALVGRLQVAPVAGSRDETRDVDTWADLADLRERLEGQGRA